MACKEVLINTVNFCQSVFFNCVDPDPYSEYGSGSTMLMNKDLEYIGSETQKTVCANDKKVKLTNQ